MSNVPFQCLLMVLVMPVMMASLVNGQKFCSFPCTYQGFRYFPPNHELYEVRFTFLSSTTCDLKIIEGSGTSEFPNLTWSSSYQNPWIPAWITFPHQSPSSPFGRWNSSSAGPLVLSFSQGQMYAEFIDITTSPTIVLKPFTTQAPPPPTPVSTTQVHSTSTTAVPLSTTTVPTLEPSTPSTTTRTEAPTSQTTTTSVPVTSEPTTTGTPPVTTTSPTTTASSTTVTPSTTTTTTAVAPTTTTAAPFTVPTSLTTTTSLETTTTSTVLSTTTAPSSTTTFPAVTTTSLITSTTSSSAPPSTTTTSNVLPSSTTTTSTTTSVPPSTPTPSIPTTRTPSSSPTNPPTRKGRETPQPTRKTSPPSQLCGKSYWFNGTEYDIEFNPCFSRSAGGSGEGEEEVDQSVDRGHIINEVEEEEKGMLKERMSSSRPALRSSNSADHAPAPMNVYNASTGVLVAKFSHVVFDWAVNSSGLFITYSSSNGNLAIVEIECDPGHFELVADYKDSRLGNLRDFVFILKSSLVCFSTTTTTTTASPPSTRAAAPPGGMSKVILYAAVAGAGVVFLVVLAVVACCCMRSRKRQQRELYDMVAEQQRGLLLNEQEQETEKAEGGKGRQSPPGGSSSRKVRSVPGTMTAKTFHGFDDRSQAGEQGGGSSSPLPGTLPVEETRSKFLSVQEVTSSAFRSDATIATEDSFLLAPGDQMTLERFNRGRQIGRGAFGTVYQGVDSESGRQLAAKELAFKSQVARERLLPGMLREVVLLKELKHANIVRYLGHDCREGELSLWIFMEYLAGGSLRSVIDSLQKTLSPQVAAGYTKQILRGLSYIHKRGFVHRDLKADNILSDVNGVMKLADFGTTMSEESVTRMVGTPCWMAPEVVTEEEGGIGTPSDIWSLGCIVIEMLTKCEYPFSWVGKSQMVMSKLASGDRAKVNEVVESAKERCSSVSPEGWEFVRKCLAFSPKDRPTAQQLLIHPFVKLADRKSN